MRGERGGHRLGLSLYVALRYLRASRGDALVTLLSTATAVGLALGVAALVIALAVLSGFQRHLLDDVLERSADLQLLLDAPPEESLRRAVLDVDGVASAQLLVVGSGWLVDRGDYRPIEIVGFEQRLPDWLPPVVAGTGPPEGIVLSERRRLAWGVTVGDRVRVVTPRPMLTPLGRPMPTRREVEVAGSFDAGRGETEVERVALPLEIARTLVGDGDLRLDVELSSPAAAERVASTLRTRLPADVEIETWRDRNRALLFVLRLEKALIFLAVFLIVVVASLALVAAMAVLVSSKLGEIGTLGALGARGRDLQRIFLLLGVLLGALGSLVGGLVGIGIALLLDRWQLIRLPAGVYIVDHLPFLVRPVDVTVVLGASLLLAFLAARWAARRVAGLDPVEAMRR